MYGPVEVLVQVVSRWSLCVMILRTFSSSSSNEDMRATSHDPTLFRASPELFRQSVICALNAVLTRVRLPTPQDADIRTSQDPFVVMLGDTEISPPLIADVSDPLAIYDDAGLVIRRATDGRTYVFDIPHHMILGVTAADHEFPTGNHMDITLEKLNVTGGFSLTFSFKPPPSNPIGPAHVFLDMFRQDGLSC